VTLGGRRVRVRRPRVRTVDGTRELPVPAYQAFASTDLLGQLALERMLAKLSTRRYPAGLEPVGTGVQQAAAGTSKSAVSRRFVAATEHALVELLAQDLTRPGSGRAAGRWDPGGRILLCGGAGHHRGRH
jgi:putative transposase